jgi:hypothetical protein
MSGFVTRSPLTDQREFWEAGGIYRPSTHPVVELFARQRVRYLGRTGLLAGVRSLLDVGAGSGFSSAYSISTWPGDGLGRSPWIAVDIGTESSSTPTPVVTVWTRRLYSAT